MKELAEKYQHIAADTWVNGRGPGDGKPEGVTAEAVPTDPSE